MPAPARLTGLWLRHSNGDGTNENRSLVLRTGNGRYRDPEYCLGSIRGLPSTNQSFRPAYSWPAGPRVYRRCVVSRGRRGDLVATDSTNRGSGISRDLPYLWPVLVASVLCCASHARFSHRYLHFHRVRACSTATLSRAWSHGLRRDWI